MGSVLKEIEINGEYIEVEFTGDCKIEDQGIGPYEYWGHHCVDTRYEPVCDDVTWDDKLYNENENKIIEEYMNENIKSITEDILCNHDFEVGVDDPPERED